MWKNLTLALILVVFLSSCATRAQSGMGAGAAAGAIAGQAIGRNTGGTLIGAAIGALLGYAIGNELDKADQANISAAYENSPDGRTSRWTNPNTGNEFAVTPQNTYKNNYNQDCREAEILATIDGKPEKIIQKACRDQYGNWITQ